MHIHILALKLTHTIYILYICKYSIIINQSVIKSPTLTLNFPLHQIKIYLYIHGHTYTYMLIINLYINLSEI